MDTADYSNKVDQFILCDIVFFSLFQRIDKTDDMRYSTFLFLFFFLLGSVKVVLYLLFFFWREDNFIGGSKKQHVSVRGK